MTGVNAESYVELDCLIELSLSGLAHEVACFTDFIELSGVNELYAFIIFLSMLHINILLVVERSVTSHCYLVCIYSDQSTTSIPMERAVPAIMDIAASTEPALRSGIFCSAIALT